MGPKTFTPVNLLQGCCVVINGTARKQNSITLVLAVFTLVFTLVCRGVIVVIEHKIMEGLLVYNTAKSDKNMNEGTIVVDSC